MAFLDGGLVNPRVAHPFLASTLQNALNSEDMVHYSFQMRFSFGATCTEGDFVLLREPIDGHIIAEVLFCATCGNTLAVCLVLWEAMGDNVFATTSVKQLCNVSHIKEMVIHKPLAKDRILLIVVMHGRACVVARLAGSKNRMYSSATMV